LAVAAFAPTGGLSSAGGSGGADVGEERADFAAQALRLLAEFGRGGEHLRGAAPVSLAASLTPAMTARAISPTSSRFSRAGISAAASPDGCEEPACFGITAT